MSAYYDLVVMSRKLRSSSDVKDSGKHAAVWFDNYDPYFIGSAGPHFFVQEYLRAAGLDAGPHTDEYVEGPSPVRDFRLVNLDDMVRMVVAEAPETPVTLVAGYANLTPCAHHPPCAPDLVSHRCGWTESKPVDLAVCEVCPHFRGETSVRGPITTWRGVKCGHPEAWRNILSDPITGGS